jgi:DNA modification methylase
MEGKIRECYRVLKNSGSMYLHCDWHANAHLRILMDNIFGEENFKNEIIWFYKGGGSSKKYFSRKHDTIFWYSKSNSWTFNLDDVRVSYSDEILSRPKSSYRHHHYKGSPKAVVNGWDLNPKGKRPDDVWDLAIINPCARERLGYPTQKPEALLERIINASSNEGEIVLDPMCGCGTCIAKAFKLKRKWIGIDVSPTACKLMVSRMRKLGIDIGENNIIGLPRTLEEIKAMQPFEFQNWVCEKLLARASRSRVGDFGIDGWLLDGRPLQVKQSENIGRNAIDNFETAIRRANKSKGIFVALSFGRGAYEEVARAKLHDELDIELKTVEELLQED